MLYQMNDKFLVDGFLCEVRYINAGMAWVFPVEDLDAGNGKTHYSFVAYAVLDRKGRDKQGRKALVVNNIGCGAV